MYEVVCMFAQDVAVVLQYTKHVYYGLQSPERPETPGQAPAAPPSSIMGTLPISRSTNYADTSSLTRHRGTKKSTALQYESMTPSSTKASQTSTATTSMTKIPNGAHANRYMTKAQPAGQQGDHITPLVGKKSVSEHSDTVLP